MQEQQTQNYSSNQPKQSCPITHQWSSNLHLVSIYDGLPIVVKFKTFMTSLRHCFNYLRGLLCFPIIYLTIQFRNKNLGKFTFMHMQNSLCQPISGQSCRPLLSTQSQNSQIFLKIKQASLHPYFNKINTFLACDLPQTEALLQGNRQVRPKMVTRVVTWLQKLCKQTLGFSSQTLETASRILVKYLTLHDEPVSNLQLLGCSCLYLSSKIWEETIVAAQSYAECSCNIFTKKDLMQKQAQIYKILDGNTSFTTLNDIYQFINSAQLEIKQAITDVQDEQIKKIISLCIKDVQFLTQNPCQLIISIIFFALSSQNLNQNQTAQSFNFEKIKAEIKLLNQKCFNKVRQ